MLDLDASVSVQSGQAALFAGPVSRTIAVLYRTMLEREDPALMFPAEVRVALGN
jgi:hypothetical protein